MKQKSTLVKGSFWILLSGMLTKLIGFLYTVIIARLISQEQIGMFYLALSILGILYIFTDLGLLAALGRYVPYLYGKKEIGKLKELIKLSYFGGGILTFIFSAGVFFFSGLISEAAGEPIIKPVLEMLAIWLFLREIDDISKGILNGRKKMKESQGIITVSQNIIKLIITLIAFYVIGFNAEALSIGFLLSFLLTIPLGLHFVIQEMKNWEKQETRFGLGEKWKLGKEVISFGIIMTVIEMFWILMQYTDRIMLGYFMENALAEIAIYSIALGLANVVLIFPGALSGIFSPVIAELYGKKDIKEMENTTNVSTKWLIMLMTPAALLMVLFSDNLLGIFYGASYETGTIVLILFVLGSFVRCLFTLPGSVLAIMLRLDVEIKAAIIASISNIILNFYLIPIWGINGAALSSMLSFIILSMIIWYYSRKVFNFRFPKEAYKPLIAGLIAFGLLLLLKPYIWPVLSEISSGIQIGAGAGGIYEEILEKGLKLGILGFLFGISCLIYFFALLMLRSFGEDEIEILDVGLKKVMIPTEYRELIKTILEGNYLLRLGGKK